MSWGTFTGFRLVIGILAIIAIVLEVITWITAFRALRKSKETNPEKYESTRKFLHSTLLGTIGLVVLILSFFVNNEIVKVVLDSIAAVTITISFILTLRKAVHHEPDN